MAQQIRTKNQLGKKVFSKTTTLEEIEPFIPWETHIMDWVEDIRKDTYELYPGNNRVTVISPVIAFENEIALLDAPEKPACIQAQIYNHRKVIEQNDQFPRKDLKIIDGEYLFSDLPDIHYRLHKKVTTDLLAGQNPKIEKYKNDILDILSITLSEAKVEADYCAKKSSESYYLQYGWDIKRVAERIFYGSVAWEINLVISNIQFLNYLKRRLPESEKVPKKQKGTSVNTFEDFCTPRGISIIPWLKNFNRKLPPREVGKILVAMCDCDCLHERLAKINISKLTPALIPIFGEIKVRSLSGAVDTAEEAVHSKDVEDYKKQIRRQIK